MRRNLKKMEIVFVVGSRITDGNLLGSGVKKVRVALRVHIPVHLAGANQNAFHRNPISVRSFNVDWKSWHKLRPFEIACSSPKSRCWLNLNCRWRLINENFQCPSMDNPFGSVNREVVVRMIVSKSMRHVGEGGCADLFVCSQIQLLQIGRQGQYACISQFSSRI